MIRAMFKVGSGEYSRPTREEHPVGSRLLVKGFGRWTETIIEVKIEEWSPSGEHAKLRYHTGVEWVKLKEENIFVKEVLSVPEDKAVAFDYQSRVTSVMLDCFGEDITSDPRERRLRAAEEFIELFQSAGGTYLEIVDIALYALERPVGDPGAELGGVLTTLAAMASALGLSMNVEAERELERFDSIKDKVKEKWIRKPRNITTADERGYPEIK